MRMKTAVMVTALLAATGCAGSGSIATTEPTEPGELTEYALPTGPTDVVLRMTTAANFPDPLPISSQFAEFTLYGDGRIIVEDREDREDREGAIPGLLEATVSPRGMQLLMAEAAASGALDPLDDYGSTGTADADSTRFLLDTGEVEVSFSVYDLGRGEGPDGELTGEQIEARAELTELRTTLRDFESLLGPEVLAGGQTVAADAVAILAREGGSDPSFELPFDVESDGTEIQTRAGPVSCLIVTGDDLAGLTHALSTVEAGPYRSGRMGAQVWTFAFRPMLPDEAGCAQLGS